MVLLRILEIENTRLIIFLRSCSFMNREGIESRVTASSSEVQSAAGVQFVCYSVIKQSPHAHTETKREGETASV